MQAIKCELCGSNQLIKKDGYYQCEYCGTKYTLEEARKLIVSGTVSIDGDVKIKEADFIIRAGTLEKYNGASTDVAIPNTVTRIGNCAFKDCRGLTVVEIPSSVTEIGKGAFANCTSLTEIEIPRSVTEIGEGAFANCTSLSKIEIPNGVTQIVSRAFANCTSLTEIEIPSSVTEIGEGAFANCTSLTKIEIPKSVTELWDDAFENCTMLSNVNIHIPLNPFAFNGTPYKKDIYSRREKNFCQYCGGVFRGIFNKVCSKCGKPKDYG